MTGNSSFLGTEMEAAGPEDFTDAQRWAYPRINAAYADLAGFSADFVAGHSEYATPAGRKQDIDDYPMSQMRAEIARLLAEGPEDFMASINDKVIPSPIPGDNGKLVSVVEALQYLLANQYLVTAELTEAKDGRLGNDLRKAHSWIRNAIYSVAAHLAARGDVDQTTGKVLPEGGRLLQAIVSGVAAKIKEVPHV